MPITRARNFQSAPRKNLSENELSSTVIDFVILISSTIFTSASDICHNSLLFVIEHWYDYHWVN